MTRLTRRNPDGTANFACSDFDAVCHGLLVGERATIRVALEKLAEFKDAEQDGRLVILPFKREDNVWMVSANEPMTVKSAAVTVCAFDKKRAAEMAEVGSV